MGRSKVGYIAKKEKLPLKAVWSGARDSLFKFWSPSYPKNGWDTSNFDRNCHHRRLSPRHPWSDLHGHFRSSVNCQTNLRTRRFVNEWSDFDSSWGRTLVEVTMRRKISLDLEAWLRHHSRPSWILIQVAFLVFLWLKQNPYILRRQYRELNAESPLRNRSLADNGRPGQEALINA